MLVKSKKYWFNLDTVRVPHETPNWNKKKRTVRKHQPNIRGLCYAEAYHPFGKNPGDVWTIPTQPFKESHFAVFPEKLVEPMIKAGCPQEGLVLDPFAGSGTTNIVAEKLGRNSIGIEINSDYVAIIKKRFEPFLKQAKLNGRTELNIIKVN